MEAARILPANVALPATERALVIEQLDYANPYDFYKPHRHDYFELIFVKSGFGTQVIDTKSYAMKPGQFYAIYPGQVHLMNRGTARGLLIQFRKDIFRHIAPLHHNYLYFKEQAFNPSEEAFVHLYDIAHRMADLMENGENSVFTTHKLYSYLQVIISSIPEMNRPQKLSGRDSLVMSFLSLLHENIILRKKVNDYCYMLNCTPERLNDACKASLGKTALKLVHEELMLEICRLMLLNKLSLKEIAYELNFDGPANFSNFIKNQSGYTPSELQGSLLKIYN
jgi:AraC family transcriptional regulator, transcriptional activator of pobA